MSLAMDRSQEEPAAKRAHCIAESGSSPTVQERQGASGSSLKLLEHIGIVPAELLTEDVLSRKDFMNELNGAAEAWRRHKSTRAVYDSQKNGLGNEAIFHLLSLYSPEPKLRCKPALKMWQALLCRHHRACPLQASGQPW